MEKTNNQKEMMELISPKNCTGIALCIAVVGLFIMCIGLFCPFCSYNPTIFDETKRNVGITDLSPIMTIILALLIIVAVALAFSSFMKFIKNFKLDKDWKEHTKHYTILSVLILVLIFIAIVVAIAACVFYEIPDSKFSDLETNISFGVWIFAIGASLFAISYSAYLFLLHNVAKGLITVEKLAIVKKAKIEEKPRTSNALTDKLLELQTLKDSGVITEEDYQRKKEELLENYK